MAAADYFPARATGREWQRSGATPFHREAK
ncbi:hypothetical protein X769_20980 [Mesorhizobium sp. LSJC268A00]|nr:hypothetical protein X770_31060 [Mesorhizobium sp. LSJC269B00]ESX01707.1 hypothetical protein X769_20980 [Mesorhizobium sp. LSJC268A00]ESZ02949.1 hypothetical protein X736_27700 [Mesorhizobium sp. L2C089B000]ESZ31674.1 hypothetical protein X733_19400 [Mesorhizobium sp. L2C067A000]